MRYSGDVTCGDDVTDDAPVTFADDLVDDAQTDEGVTSLEVNHEMSLQSMKELLLSSVRSVSALSFSSSARLPAQQTNERRGSCDT